MKAAVCERYGPPEVVQIREVPTPVPADGEVLVKASATTVNSGDARLRALRVPRGMAPPARLSAGVTKPKQPVFGFDVAGRVEAVGEAVTGFQPGDRVVASRGLDLGCHAQLVTVDDEHKARIRTLAADFPRLWTNPATPARDGNVNPIWPHCDGLKWPHLMARCCAPSTSERGA